MKILFGFFLSLFIPAFALAASPEPWQLGFQEPASPVMEIFNDVHNMLLIIITAVSVFILALLIYVCLRFNKKANPTPSKTTHNVSLEIIWTVIPVIILIVIAIPSIRTLYYSDRITEADMTLKVIGYQWYWNYSYPDHGDITFDSYMIPDEDLKPGQLRLLEVDNRVVGPIDTNIRVLITAGDVLHAWAVPAFGVKRDAVPGRLNETWMRINKPGVYYGQCSELCGVGHGFMPVVVEAVSKKEFERWVRSAKKKFASSGSSENNLASLKY